MAVNKITAKKLREQRADLIEKAQALIAEKQDAQGLLGAEDQAAVDKMLADAQAFGDQAKQREALETAAAGLDQPIGDGLGSPIPAGDQSGQAGGDGAAEGFISVRMDTRAGARRVNRRVGARGTAAYHAAFTAALTGHATPSQMATVVQSDNPDRAGVLLPSEQFVAEILKEIDDEVFVRRFANVTTVPTADSLGIRKRTAKLSTFAWGQELTAPTDDAALAYGKRSLTPHYLTGGVPVSKDLLRRLGSLADGEIRGEIARDGGEIMEQAYMTGSGAGQPLGVFVASSDGISTARDAQTGSATGITAAGLIAAKYTLKSPYRRSTGSRAGARWLFHRDGISKIAQLTDTAVGFLLRPGRGLEGEDTDMLLGLPLDESEFCPNTFTTGQYVGLLGNWQIGYRIADALDMELQVLEELLALTNQNYYIARIKTDGQPVLEEAFVRLITN